MIKNVVFDFGNTVIHFVPREIIKYFGVNEEEDISVLETIIFDRKYWDKLDDGSLSQDEFRESIINKVPDRYRQTTLDICDNWYKALPEIEGMRELIESLKKKGKKIYLLSNISEEFVKHKEKIEIFKLFDGFVFSGVEKMAKPDRKIFELLLDRYNLDAKSCLFVDDLEKNVETAKNVGFKAFLFKGKAREVEEYLSCLDDD